MIGLYVHSKATYEQRARSVLLKCFGIGSVPAMVTSSVSATESVKQCRAQNISLFQHAHTIRTVQEKRGREKKTGARKHLFSEHFS